MAGIVTHRQFNRDELRMEYLRRFERGTLKSYAASAVKA